MRFSGMLAAVRSRALHLGVALGVAVACVSLVGIDTWRTFERRAELIQEDKDQTANLVRSLSQHAHDTVQAIDTAIVTVRQIAETEGVNSHTFARLDQLMQVQTASLPMMHGIFIFDATGQYVADSLTDHRPTLNGSDRAYFKYHASNPDRSALLGDPVRSKIDGVWIVTVSRRLNTPDGGFAGVVVSTISVDSMQAFYETFDVGPHGAIALINDTGILVARKPADKALVGTNLSNGQFFSAARRGGRSGSFQYVSSLDGVTRLGSFQRVDGFPLMVLASHGLDDVLAEWRRSGFYHLVVSSLVAAAMAVLGVLLFAQVRKRQRVEAALALNDRQYTMLAENSTDVVVHVDVDLRRLYISPACRTLLGYEASELLGRPMKDIVHTEDWPAVVAALADVERDGTIMCVSYRARKRIGVYLWVETTGRRLPDRQGYVLTVRDITQRRVAEAALQKSNEQLQHLAMVDALTSVGNKDAFDLALRREYERVERSDRPLSLLIVDLDHFGMYNDRFGPIAGDRCLRGFAKKIRLWLPRSSDCVARISDDEFAILLPEVDREGAVDAAEQLCEIARGLNSSDGEEAAVGRISVSIGVAAVWPKRQTKGPQDLIYDADEALTAAKTAGRDCWRASSAVSDPTPPALERPPESNHIEHSSPDAPAPALHACILPVDASYAAM